MKNLVISPARAQIACMATNAATLKNKPVVLGRSAASGRFVLAPVVTKKTSISDERITAAVKSVLAKRK